MPYSFAEFYASVLTVPSVLTAYRSFHSLGKFQVIQMVQFQWHLPTISKLTSGLSLLRQHSNLKICILVLHSRGRLGSWPQVFDPPHTCISCRVICCAAPPPPTPTLWTGSPFLPLDFGFCHMAGFGQKCKAGGQHSGFKSMPQEALCVPACSLAPLV